VQAGALRARGRVPAKLAWLEGHFPGHPIVPGFVQLDWALALAREALGVTAAPGRIEALRFRSPLLPEVEFELAVEASGGALRFELGEAGAEVSCGRLHLDPALGQHRPEAGPAAPPGPGLPLRLPHAGRMRLLERVLHHETGVTLCEAQVSASTPLLESGRAPAWLALELLAQGMAAHGGLAAPGPGEPRRALLVGARRVELRTRGFAEGERLWIRAEPLRRAAGLVAFACALGAGASPADAADARARSLASGELRAFIASTPGSSASLDLRSERGSAQ
jgi:predicted hotdog family 3-hydroxylacyl-ACP dehydratase